MRRTGFVCSLVLGLSCGIHAVAAQGSSGCLPGAGPASATRSLQGPAQAPPGEDSQPAPASRPSRLPGARPSGPAEGAPASEPSPKGQVQNPPSVTRHTIQVDGRTLHYTATAGLLSVHNEEGAPQAEIFYVAYTRDGMRPAARPITFAFNGGPGAASIWLHLAALGPKRVVLGEEGTALPARYRLVDNRYTWLDFTDLVFVDPPGTGFSRAAAGVDPKQLYNLKSDVHLIGEFIRLYVTSQDRWLSPKFLVGESYGTTRAAALAGHLPSKVGMTLSGLILISAALDFQAITFDEGNDLAYVLFVPSYAAVAWYHHRLPSALQRAPLEDVLAEVEGWANGEYRSALAQGDALSPQQRDRALDRYASYTGLSKEFVDRCNLRVTSSAFSREILRPSGKIVGILDGRVTGIAAGREDFVTDPSVFVTVGPLVATLYDYTRQQLDFRTERPYEFLNAEVGRAWSWGSAAEGFPSVLAALRQAISADSRMKVLVAAGYYDLDTSYFSQKHSIDHLLLDPGLRSNVRIVYYPAGHQLYTYLPALESLTERAAGFYAGAQD